MKLSLKKKKEKKTSHEIGGCRVPFRLPPGTGSVLSGEFQQLFLDGALGQKGRESFII